MTEQRASPRTASLSVIRVWSERSEATRLDNSPHVWAWQGASIDVRGKVPAWVEADLDRGIAVSRSFQHVEQPVDTERVEIAQRGRSADPVPRPQRLPRANLNQQPSPPSWARSEEHTLNSSHPSISYAVFCLKKKK